MQTKMWILTKEAHCTALDILIESAVYDNRPATAVDAVGGTAGQGIQVEDREEEHS